MLHQADSMYGCTNAAALVANCIRFFASAARTDAPSETSTALCKKVMSENNVLAVTDVIYCCIGMGNTVLKH